MELHELRRHWEGKSYEFYNRHGAYGQRKEAQALANLDAAELRRQGFLSRVTFETQDYGIWAVVWKGPKVREAQRVEVVPDPHLPDLMRLAKITRNGVVVAARYAEPFPTEDSAWEDFKRDPRAFLPFDESTNRFVVSKAVARRHKGHHVQSPRLSR